MISLDRLDHRAIIATHRIALVGFTGLVMIALLTFYDGAARYLDLPRVSGFADVGELLFPSSSLPAFRPAHPAEKSHHPCAGSGGRGRHCAIRRSGGGGCRAHFLHALRACNLCR